MYRHGKEEIEAATRVLKSDYWFRYGSPEEGHLGEATKLEVEWEKYMDVPYASMTNSGTAALMCAYAGLGLGPGDEVIIPGYTWIATASAPLLMGVIPVIVDIDESLMIDPKAIEAAITPRTKAICPVHMVGLACDMDKILAIAKKHKLYVIEDTCQADGGLWKDGRHLGTLADFGAYSFNYFKVIACGDGGMFVTHNNGVFERALIFHDAGIGFRAHAKDMKTPIFAGMNLRGNEILAAVVRAQLSRLNGIITDLHKVNSAISKAVKGAKGLKPIPRNGGEGTGTGASLGYQFATEAEARKFAKVYDADERNAKSSAEIVFDSGRHVYMNWEVVMSKRGAHHPDQDPFRHPKNAATAPKYRKDMLPKTLDILKRTVRIGVNPDWTDKQARGVADAIKDAAGAKTKMKKEPAGVR